MRYSKQKHLLDSALKIALEGRDLGDFYIAGGAVRSVFAGEPIRDLDLYFFKEPSEVILPEKDFELLFSSFVADTWRNKKNGKIVQIIKKFYGDPEKVIRKFDFTISMGAYIPKDGVFILDDRFLYHLAEKRLVFNVETDYPLSSLWRVKKFLHRGYNIGAVDLIALGLKIHSLKLETFSDLKEQIDGIDTLLLKPLTDRLIEDKGGDKYDLLEFLGYIENKIESIWGKE